jgi:RES domain-containing protein
MEIFVHMGAGLAPKDHVLIAIDVPDDIMKAALLIDPLPSNWNQMPESDAAKKAGTDWAKSGSGPVLRVPSVVVPVDENVLINPGHADIAHIKASVLGDFRFDPRMIR